MIYAVTVYYNLGPKFGLLVRKRLASIGIESLEVRWSFSYKSISEFKGYLDWDCNVCVCVCVCVSVCVFVSPPLVTLALSGPEEALILVW